ncbi:pyridoxamine 5'-phosphate oxidase family protein [Frankia sp. CNm7]|uniref:Pyridoxamine 5'-phosphate oxidase family protein n=1 Tax=Frankia nepalensis TaxID=1836974 RepID=A0A937RJH0_9ACTN|nr:pyridoxamine 5'-phosphate oxidase family protein [Frankia nepalensis]MBL7501110.1 pyridoxamine 5'-phosphate oxidase family protein [Frankia nepalensis]MBL7512732.1 pyridoxamine 5'-phosphate oxidase family protein [Frankia nepalensis]MBL7524122.1 pyridoxamine 5'-phosphate oxidase family protein [Frankia nepalensis]MBL7631312.1 pyridoxamine 5'-phosphate oxidase family protein [Frankia nepalensis]
MFHPGERAVQARAGLPADPRGSAVVGATIPPVAAHFLEQQRMLLIGAADEAGAVWASPLTGAAGFVAAADEETIVVHALPGAGDPLEGVFTVERDVGLLALDPAARRRMRANGKARRDGDRLVVRTEQVYSNCPKYIQLRHLAPDDAEAARRPVSVTTALTASQRRWIAEADTFFVATQAAGLGADTSHRGGNPGFVTATADRRLTWPDYVGNSMYMTLGNLDLDPRCGLLFLDWEHGHTLQLTGRARVDWNPDRAAGVPGARRLVDFEVEQVVQVSAASPQRWSFGGYFRLNPA